MNKDVEKYLVSQNVKELMGFYSGPRLILHPSLVEIHLVIFRAIQETNRGENITL